MPRGRHGSHARADRQHRWTEDKIVGSNGYVKLRVGRGHPLADPNGYAYEHLVVWCSAGRPRPTRQEILHHRNGVKTDNRLNNLELMTRSAHNAEHLKHRRRCQSTGRLLDGVLHDAMPEVGP